MKKKRPPFNVNSTIRGAIRRTFARCPAALEVKNAGRREVPKYNKDGSRSKKDSVQYNCQICKEWVSSTKISVDHIEPVISIEDGFIDWNTFVDRMGFEKPENLQRVCDDCHQTKTNAERFARGLKQDYELVRQYEISASIAENLLPENRGNLKKALNKFNKKKLAAYPADLVERILKLKELARNK